MKLVRDKIPARYGPEKYRQAKREEMALLLRLKLAEEAGEALSAPTSSHLLVELADLAEVIEALLDVEGFSYRELTEAMATKRAHKGGFTEGWVLE
jgi:predicted house-cleaning noncanonical NTP pyrophosphatase (MazG superfamily)